MIRLNQKEVAKLHKVDDLLTERYGKPGTPSRKDFENKALAWYYGEVLRDKRKELKITQQQLAERIGKKREYIALLERGKTDMQLSTFLDITQALGLKLSLMGNE
ncbi:MAG: helix-turn-helix transcriptional regulator [Bacteroidales bacterium]